MYSANTKKEYILTKGDNNSRDDRVLYDRRQMWIHRENVVGKVKG
jgi:signal peptidase